QTGFDDPLVTQVQPLTEFRHSDPRFHRYFERHEGGPFCTRYIDPKLAYLRAANSALALSDCASDTVYTALRYLPRIL
ncbi:MAG: hypothetical protein AAFR49_03200, partial [Pseudomonadota bacterium]